MTGPSGSSGSVGDGPRGHGPRGMWWVAWRQHRLTVLIALLVVVLVALAVLVFQLVLIGRLHAAGCTVLTDPNACNSRLFPSVQNAFDENTWHLLRGVLVATPVVLGVFVGAPLFPREFDERAQVFALTQSVGRLRWWATKITVAGVPLLAGLVGLGYLVQWCDATTWYTDRNAFDDGTFQVRGIMLAAFGLLALAIAVTVGILVRSITASTVVGLIVAGGAVVLIAFPLRSHLVPITRDVTPIQAAGASYGPVPGDTTGAGDPANWFLGSGLLDADGNPLPPYSAMMACESSLPPPRRVSSDESDGSITFESGPGFTKALRQCQREHGITKRYLDYVPASMLWPLREIVTGVCALLAALALAFGAFRLRPAVSKR